MVRPTDSTDGPDPTALRQIPHWAGRYARNRSLPVLVSLFIFTAAFLAMSGLSLAVGLAWRDGAMVRLAVLLTLDLALCVAWLVGCLTRGLQNVITTVSDRLYGAEGQVVPEPSRCRPGPHKAVGAAFALCIAASVLAPALGMPIVYMQPLSAAYAVPFLVYFWYTQGGLGTPFMLLWPVLYGLHALLILARVPALTQLNPMFAILLPMCVYGALAGIASHLYSRCALRTLRSLAQSPTADDTGGETDE